MKLSLLRRAFRSDPPWHIARLNELLEQAKSLPPDSRAEIAYWFDLMLFADQMLNRAVMTHYDGKHPKHHLWSSQTDYIVDNVRAGDRVLDIGCGASFYQQRIADKAASVTGVDILPDRVELARKNNAKANVTFELMDATKGVPPGRFDVAICSHVIEHLEDPITLLRALAQSVPRIIVRVPAEDATWYKLVKRDLGLFWMDDRDHKREYTLELLRQQLEDSGWRVTDLSRGFDLRAMAESVQAA